MRIVTYLGLGLVLLISMWPSLGQAQEIHGISDTMQLNFGYPILKAKDDLIFTDENENQQIDPNEGCVITFTLMNTSRYPALDVLIKPRELNGIQGLNWPDEVNVGNIAQGGRRIVEINILASEPLAEGTANFAFTVLEGDAVESATVIYSVPVNRPDAPPSSSQSTSSDDESPAPSPTEESSEPEDQASIEEGNEK
jgi:hypothetical protein